VYSTRVGIRSRELRGECIGTSLRSRRGFFFTDPPSLSLSLFLSLSLPRVSAFHSFLSGWRKVLTAIRDGIVAQPGFLPIALAFDLSDRAVRLENGRKGSRLPLPFPVIFYSTFLSFFFLFFFRVFIANITHETKTRARALLA